MKLKSKKYLSDIEYSIGIIGEAVNNFKKTENIYLYHSREIVAFRNRLIHAYNNLEDEIIWAIIKQHIPKIKEEIISLLDID